MQRLYPAPLKPGDRVSVIAPAGHLKDTGRYLKGCAIISDMGFDISYRERKWPGHDYLSDTDERRAEEFHRAWADPDIKAIFTLRGGYGSLRLMNLLDMALVRNNPKFFVGFSDITILHNYLYQQTGLMCLHGPVLSSLEYGERSNLERLHQCLLGNWHQSLQEDIEIVRDGPVVNGDLRGGNLSSLVSMIGTPWEPDFTGAIVFLEDINEPMYRLDRLLTQLVQSNMLRKVTGIILGDFSEDRDFDRNERIGRHEFVWNRLCDLTDEHPMVIWGNFPVGHCARNVSLPIGIPARMDSGKRTLSFSVPQHQD